MVRDVGPAFTQVISQLRRERRTLEQAQQDPTAHPIGHRRAHPRQDVETIIDAEVDSHANSIVQPLLYYTNGCTVATISGFLFDETD